METSIEKKNSWEWSDQDFISFCYALSWQLGYLFLWNWETSDERITLESPRMTCIALRKNLSFCINFFYSGYFITSLFFLYTVWYGVIFIRMGDYQDGIFKFTMTAPDNFPDGDCPVSITIILYVYYMTSFYSLIQIYISHSKTSWIHVYIYMECFHNPLILF